MNKELKETLAFIINLNSQILENQVNAINGKLTNKGLEKSQVLVRDCVEVINKLSVKKSKDIKEVNIPKDVVSIFHYWKERGLTQHIKIDGFVRGIKTGLKNSSFNELKNCIYRYAMAFFDDESSLSYVWSIDEFCSSKYKKFETDERVEANYYKRYNGIKSNQSTIISNEEAIRSFNS